MKIHERGETTGPAFPWCSVTARSGLMLHAAATVAVALAPLRADFAALDAAIGPELRGYFGSDGSWSSIALVERAVSHAGGPAPPGVVTPALAHAPAIRALLSRAEWQVLACYVMRQPPHGVLAWHFDNQAPHLPDCRLLLPLWAPTGAVTRIGHTVAAYLAGTLWTADFSFPHQVENPTDAPRIVLAIDLLSGPAVRTLLPAGLVADAPTRLSLAREAQSHLLRWRARQAAA